MWTSSLRELTSVMVVQEELIGMAAASQLTLSYSSESSIEAELKRESTADVLTIAVSSCCSMTMLGYLFVLALSEAQLWSLVGLYIFRILYIIVTFRMAGWYDVLAVHSPYWVLGVFMHCLYTIINLIPFVCAWLADKLSRHVYLHLYYVGRLYPLCCSILCDI